ncbi:MAG: flagellar motor protein MotB, partial [Pseudonocardiales bacterium]|nr:flagellar motor protein MotB [Pseudonocardiales bacterium]
INSALDRGGMSGAVQFAIDRRGLIITVITNALVFPGNSATLLPEGQRILGVIAPPLDGTSNNIEVDGFTNQEKVSTDPYPSGWELSSARASAVVRYLIHGGVLESRLSAVGFSDQRPLYPANDPRSITRNRRVEVVVLSSLPPAAGDQLQAAGGS